MVAQLALRCQCGALQGVARGVSASTGNHVVCHCDDCQAFVEFLGRGAEILDPHGGTNIFQMSIASLSITQGADRLACLKLSDRGMLRWYSSCCKTPMANTMSTRTLPFVGVLCACFEQWPGENSLQADLGPVQMHVFKKFARGNVADIPADRRSLPRTMMRFAALMLKWKLRGDSKRSMFFGPVSGQPVAMPLILTSEQRAALYRLTAGK